MEKSASATLEEYLEVIYKIADAGEARPAQIAEALDVSPPTVTGGLKRLEAIGLISRKEGAVVLTRTGRAEALDIIRRHRLAERLLVDVLGLPWDEVHDEACRLEHALSPRVQQALEEFLQRPDVCPHGHPIPSADGTIAALQGVPLSELGPGAEVRVVRVAEDDEGLLSYLASLGMFPGVEMTLCEVAPFRGPLLVRVEGSQYAIGREVASRIIVEPAGAAE